MLIGTVATESHVMITGESGTGKELVARTIHQLSDRKAQSFVPVNCGAIPENLLESEFFEHRRGAFTGADRDKTGYFDQAHQGTLFLDEVGELSPLLQVKLLRAIEGGEYTPIGSTLRTTALADPHPTKVIASTNQMLAEDAQDNIFVTAFYGLYNRETRRLFYINAGHTNALLFKPSSNSCASLLNGNLPLGILTPVQFQQSEMFLEPGDLLILYTDGINEAVNPSGEQFGLPRLVELILHQPPCSPKELQETILQAVKGFSEGQEQQDDMTVMVVQV